MLQVSGYRLWRPDERGRAAGLDAGREPELRLTELFLGRLLDLRAEDEDFFLLLLRALYERWPDDLRGC